MKDHLLNVIYLIIYYDSVFKLLFFSQLEPFMSLLHPISRQTNILYNGSSFYTENTIDGGRKYHFKIFKRDFRCAC